MEILCVCPANCTTGGPEAIHVFTSELNSLPRVNARIWYWNTDGRDPQPDEYKSYGCEYVTALPDNYFGVIIFPEIWANKALEYPQCKRAVWWLGLDAYAGWTSETERGKVLEDDSIVHIVQSEYAREFLMLMGVRDIVKCTDYVNADFYEPYKEMGRTDTVLYNPAKATPFMRALISSCPEIEWKPIQGMGRAQVIDAMRHSKLYVDFGEFPGRERIPREAVLCGCCLITSKIGSAGYYQDFSHGYKFESKPSHIWAIRRKIHEVLDNYDRCRPDFDTFRWVLNYDRDTFRNRCGEVVRILERTS